MTPDVKARLVRARVEMLTGERAALWRRASQTRDPDLRRQLRRIDEEIADLWQLLREQRATVEANASRATIMRRARAHARLERELAERFPATG